MEYHKLSSVRGGGWGADPLRIRVRVTSGSPQAPKGKGSDWVLTHFRVREGVGGGRAPQDYKPSSG